MPSLEGLVRTVAPSGSVVNVVGGPECADGKVWWQVQATVVGFTYTGWMAEVGNGLPLLVSQDVPSTEDGTLCDVPLPFAAGTRALSIIMTVLLNTYGLRREPIRHPYLRL